MVPPLPGSTLLAVSRPVRNVGTPRRVTGTVAAFRLPRPAPRRPVPAAAAGLPRRPHALPRHSQWWGREAVGPRSPARRRCRRHSARCSWRVTLIEGRRGSVLLVSGQPLHLGRGVGLGLALGALLLDGLAGLLRHRLSGGLVGHWLRAPSSGA